VTPSHWAASLDDGDALEGLLAAGADVDRADGRGRTPSSVAVHRGHAKALGTLITAGANVRAVLAAVKADLKTQRVGKAAQQAKNAALSAENAALSAENAALSSENAEFREVALVDVVDVETGCVVQETFHKRARTAAPLAGPIDKADAAPPRSALSVVN
jgi:ankyrin repeat protein